MAIAHCHASLGFCMGRLFLAPFLILAISASGCTGQRLPPPPEAVAMDLPKVRGVEGPDKIRF